MSGEQIKPGYKRTEVGVIPEDWVCAPLSDFLSFISYGFTNPMPTVLDGVYMITAADISDGRLQLDTARKTSAHAYKSLLTSKSKPRQNDILLTKDGTLGRLGLVGDEVICVNQSVAVLRSNEKALPSFLKLLLESPYYQKRMVDEAGGSTIKHIYITIVDQMPIGLPADKTEQRAIATALSDVDALLAKLDQLIAKKRDLKQATMQQLLTGQTRLPGFSGAWEVKRLGDVAFANWGNVEITKDYYCESGFTAYSASGADGLVSWYEHEGEGIVLSAIGAQCGKSWLATGKWTPIKNTIWIKGLPDKLNSSFLYWISQSPDFWPTRGQAQPFIALGDVRNVFLSCPSLSEQIVIATVMSDMDAELAVLEARRDKTRALKQGMMQELLTGRIRLV